MSRIATYLGDRRILTETVHGTSMFLDTRDIVISPLIILKGEWEPETTRSYKALLKPGMNYVEVGASVGYFSCIAAQIVCRNGGKVWAFEADPETYGFLVDNVALNWRWENVHLENLAVYSTDTHVSLYVRQKYKGNTNIANIPKGELEAIGDETHEVRVRAITLDSYFADRPERIDVCKIDVEGAELHVLRGMRTLIEGNPQMVILIEWSPTQLISAGSNPEELISSLSDWRVSLIGETITPIEARDLSGISHAMLLLRRGAWSGEPQVESYG